MLPLGVVTVAPLKTNNQRPREVRQESIAHSTKLICILCETYKIESQVDRSFKWGK